MPVTIFNFNAGVSSVFFLPVDELLPNTLQKCFSYYLEFHSHPPVEEHGTTCHKLPYADRILRRFHKFLVISYYVLYLYFFLAFGATAPQWARASSFMRCLDQTRPRCTVGRTPLDERSARRRDYVPYTAFKPGA